MWSTHNEQVLFLFYAKVYLFYTQITFAGKFHLMKCFWCQVISSKFTKTSFFHRNKNIYLYRGIGTSIFTVQFASITSYLLNSWHTINSVTICVDLIYVRNRISMEKRAKNHQIKTRNTNNNNNKHHHHHHQQTSNSLHKLCTNSPVDWIWFDAYTHWNAHFCNVLWLSCICAFYFFSSSLVCNCTKHWLTVFPCILTQSNSTANQNLHKFPLINT